MLEIPMNIQEDIDSIIYYYNQKKIINELRESISKKQEEINSIKNKITAIELDLQMGFQGEYKTCYDFVKLDGKYTTQEIRKKVKEGRFENLTTFLASKNEKSAINQYLISKGYKISATGELVDDTLYGVENSYDLYEED